MRILLDCDGVLADFGKGFAALAREQGIDYTQPRCWDVFKGLSRNERKRMERAVLQPGFCRSLPVVPGARDMVDGLRSDGHDVYCVTAFWFDHPTWTAERTAWLESNMGIDRRRVVHTHAKALVYGDVFVDDKVSHVREWWAQREDAQDGKQLAFLATWCGDVWMGDEDRDWRNTAASPLELLDRVRASDG
jgi:5'(3')-deoxyribonucleotidase